MIKELLKKTTLLTVAVAAGLSLFLSTLMSDETAALTCSRNYIFGRSNTGDLIGTKVLVAGFQRVVTETQGGANPNKCYSCSYLPTGSATAKYVCTDEQDPIDMGATTDGTIIPQGNTPQERANSYCTQYADRAMSSGHGLDRNKLVDACKKGYQNGNPNSQVCPSVASQGQDYRDACQNGYIAGAANGCRKDPADPTKTICDNSNVNEATLAPAPGSRTPGGNIGGTGFNGGDAKCSKVDTGIVNCSDNAGVLGPVIFIIRVMSVCVGIVAVGGIAWGGFQYATAQGNSDRVAQAISTIRNTIVGLLIFASLVAVANFIAPVSIFG